MARSTVDYYERLALSVRSSEKATLRCAAALQHMDITTFVVRTALREATAVIAESERMALSERNTPRVLDLLENPPAPNAKLWAAARGLPPER